MIQSNVNLEKVGISSSNLEQERRGCSLRFCTRASEQPKLENKCHVVNLCTGFSFCIYEHWILADKVRAAKVYLTTWSKFFLYHSI